MTTTLRLQSIRRAISKSIAHSIYQSRTVAMTMIKLEGNRKINKALMAAVMNMNGRIVQVLHRRGILKHVILCVDNDEQVCAYL